MDVYDNYSMTPFNPGNMDIVPFGSKKEFKEGIKNFNLSRDYVNAQNGFYNAVNDNIQIRTKIIRSSCDYHQAMADCMKKMAEIYR